MYLSFSKKLTDIANKSGVFPYKIYYYSTTFLYNLKNIKGIVCWKIYQNQSKSFAKKHNIPLIQLEDGLIGYLENTKGKMVNIGFYIDTIGGIYYSTEENIITKIINDKHYSQNELEEAKKLIQRIVENKITKYNKISQPKFQPTPNTAPILLIDQVFQDKSITTNGHGTQEFQKMYHSAIKRADGKKIYVKTHSYGKGYLEKICKNNNVIFLKEDYNLYNILEYIEEVFTVSSQSGFEALIAGKKVHTFGTPFYAGYGLTIDDISLKRPQVSLEKIFYASYLEACKYFISGVECNLNEIIDIILEQRRLTEKDNKFQKFFLYQIPLWKSSSIKDFIFQKNSNIIRVKNKKLLTKHKPTSKDAVIIWGFKNACENLLNYTENNNIPVITFEDGFIRSVGLGSDFTPAYSFVMDHYGIYYNPQQKSELEVILETFDINQHQTERLAKLQNTLVEMKISKYNVNQNINKEKPALLKQQANNKKIILITGQVSDDMSIIKSGIMISDYRTLVEKVRNENPDAFIIYKHHPDVIVGNRSGYISSQILKQFVDVIIKNINIIDLIKISDEIHTITSLSGFEALLHGKTVVHYGLPFYGGYGFTVDKSFTNHKRKPVDFKTFCYSTFFLYPRYTTPNLHIALTPEVIVKVLQKDSKNKRETNYFRRKTMQIFSLIKLYFK